MNAKKKRANSIITYAKLGNLEVGIKNDELLELLNYYYNLKGRNQVNKHTITNAKRKTSIENALPIEDLKNDIEKLLPYLNGDKTIHDTKKDNNQSDEDFVIKYEVDLSDVIKNYIQDEIDKRLENILNDSKTTNRKQIKEIDFNNPEDIKLINEVIEELDYEGDFKHSEVLANTEDKTFKINISIIQEDKKDLENKLKEYQGGLTNKEYENLKRKLKKEYSIDI